LYSFIEGLKVHSVGNPATIKGSPLQELSKNPKAEMRPAGTEGILELQEVMLEFLPS